MILAIAALAVLELQVCRKNIGAEWNGYGAIDGTFTKTNLAPMRYRVLVPWLLGWIPRKTRIWIYLVLKAALVGLTLWAAQRVIGEWQPLALLIAVSFQFDYWDQYLELLGILGCMSGHPWVVGVSALFWGLSKETALIAPIIHPMGVFGWVGMAIARLAQGDAELYCKRFTFLAYNWPDLKACIQRKDPYPAIAVVWSLFAIYAVIQGASPLILAYVIAAWTLARAREIRVLLPTAVWMM